ncbi:hypothetical protein [Streptomyces sp. NPDC047042]|uniref:hypothetical protein n=1 Tax=Streptomyces sp. NPDC047042 TaxID=3154807 RepID=UPI0033CE078B
MTDTATRPVDTGTPRHAPFPPQVQPRVPPQVTPHSPPPIRAWAPPPAPETPPITPLVNRPRGRHRKPRPRKVLLAAGGFALAAGVLSLVRLTPDGGVDGVGRAQAQSDLDVDTSTGQSEGTYDDTSTDRTDNTAATVGDVPRATPSASAPMGGGATPAPTTPPTALPTDLPSATGSLRRLPLDALPTPLAPAADATTIPQQPSTPEPVPTPARPGPAAPPPAPVAQQPQPPQQAEPAPAPTPAPSSPAPKATPPAGVCVPLIGLCVDPLSHHH